MQNFQSYSYEILKKYIQKAKIAFRDLLIIRY